MLQGMTNRGTPRPSTPAKTLFFCFLASTLEGFDNTSMGLAAPKVLAQLHLSAPQLGLVLSAVPIGMLLGAILGGRLADAVGRKRTLLTALAVTGTFQLATAVAPGYSTLIVVRACCGMGIGAALPSVIALASESAGESGGVFNVILVMAGFPAGGTLASVIAIAGGDLGDWRTNFYIGGLAPLLWVATMTLALPESREFLMVRTAERDGLSAEGSFAALFRGPGAPPTPWLWIAHFTTSAIVYVLVNWTPALMTLNGFSKTEAVWVSLPVGIGGVVGPILIGSLIRKQRRFWPLLLCYAGVAVGLIGLATVGRDLLLVFTAISFPATLVQAASLTLAGLTPRCYPTLNRGTGTGAAVGAARLGAISGPATIGWMLGSGLTPNQVLWSLVPLALVGGLATRMLLKTVKLTWESTADPTKPPSRR